MKDLQPEMKQAVDSLVTALKQSPLFTSYATALATMEADSRSTALLNELEQVQGDLRVRQANGSVTWEDTQRLRHLQAAVQADPTIAAFIAADGQVRAFLPQVNAIISDLIGIDFASLGRSQGCC